MPRGWVRLSLGLLLVATACSSRNPASPAPEAAERLQKLQEEEGDVLARRAELSRERNDVVAKRVELDAERRRVAASGGDTAPVEAELTALHARESKLIAEENALGGKIDGLIRGYQEMSATGGGRDAAAREAQVAVREKDFARREAALAQREAALADREKEVAHRERDREPCAPAVAAMPPAVAARYSRKDVEPLISSARRKMGEKGLLGSDLPGPARDLEREAAEAMSGGDYARARFAADQLVATVESLKVDKAFIMAKIGRLNGTVKGAKLAEAQKQQVDDLFRDATADYGDGNFAAANSKLNRIYGIVR